MFFDYYETEQAYEEFVLSIAEDLCEEHKEQAKLHI